MSSIERKLIGVCLARIQDYYNADLLNELNVQAVRKGYKLVVFNSFVDFYKKDGFDEGASAIYDLANFNVLDAVIVIGETFHDDLIVKNICERALEYDIPVILINDKLEGCYSIYKEYKDTYKKLIRHVIKEHGRRDTYFISGLKGEQSSNIREQAYKEVLSEEGIEFSDDMIGYGEYWGGPACRIIDELCEGGKTPPGAIFCANDNMAIDVCAHLNDYGFRVPEDVIVTGFDGTVLAHYNKPKLTTCVEKIEKTASICISLLNEALDKNVPRAIHEELYETIFTESCGCKSNELLEPRIDSIKMFEQLWDNNSHEVLVSGYITHSMNMTDINQLCSTIPEWLEPGSYVCLNQNIIASIMNVSEDKTNGIDSKMMLFSSCKDSPKASKMNIFSSYDMVPDIPSWQYDSSAYLLSALYVGEEVLGYYAVRVNDFASDTYKIMRFVKALNIIFNSVLNHCRQRALRLNMERAANINPITELPNLKAATGWFEKYSSVAANHDKKLMVGVYRMEKYSQIYENCGLEEIESVICFIAEAFKFANTGSFVAHIADDEFLVIMEFDSEDAHCSELVDKSVGSFYNIIEGFNRNNSKDYKLDIRFGYAEITKGWENNLSSFVKAALAQLFINSFKYGSGSAENETITSEEKQNLYNLLIEQNLFDYHFQPIVSAKTGDIIAYEALMRTPDEIGMTPYEVISIAKECKRLYDIEKATFFNILKRYTDDPESFSDKKIFVNSIPGYFLKEKDREDFNRRYSHCLDSVVVEITEENTLTDQELYDVRHIGGTDVQCKLAVDDYGAGHSNIVNLLRYSPEIIKVDRFLISDIDKDKNKQMFFKNTVEFGAINNIKVLAEGVETREELETVIELGADLIQGYFTGRPIREPIPELDADIKKIIIDANRAC